MRHNLCVTVTKYFLIGSVTHVNMLIMCCMLDVSHVTRLTGNTGVELNKAEQYIPRMSPTPS